MGTAKQNRWKNENGEIMLESSIVLVFVLLLLMALLCGLIALPLL